METDILAKSSEKTSLSAVDTEEEDDVERIDYENDGEFYEKAQKYWKSVDPNVNGMLGGFSQISPKELQSSKQFLDEIYRTKPCPERKTVLDCGAGIGRVTKGLLIPYCFETVDMVEQDEHFCTSAPEYIGATERLGKVYNSGLQDFEFQPQKYDVIWCQWVLGHLKDNDLVDFLKRAQTGLKKHGVIVIKENFTSNDEIEVDEMDSSVTRPLKYAKELITRAGLRVFKAKKQTAMPNGLYPIHMLAMRPFKTIL